MDPITFNYDESLFQGSIENPTWTTANIGTTGYGENFHVADIDGDGDLDYVSGMNNDNIAWHENDGNVEPSWTTHLIPHNLDTGGSNGANHVHSADVDDDGDMDIIASFHYIDTVVWFENDGSADPTWTVVEIATDIDGAFEIFTEDMDVDGDMDIVMVSKINDGPIVWCENDGAADPSWTIGYIATIHDRSADVFVADIDGDGDMDVVAPAQAAWPETLGKIIWYENDGATDPSWTVADEFAVHNPTTVQVADMDGDGDLDIVSGARGEDEGPNPITWYENDGAADPSWVAADIALTGDNSGLSDIVAKDMDDDGDIDIVAALYNSDTIAWYENDGNADPTWAAANISTSVDAAYHIVARDMDGDGVMDVSSLGAGNKRINWHENDGTRSSTAHWSISPSLPEGLTLNSTTGEITGTPTEVMNLTDYKVTLSGIDPDTYSYYDGTGNAYLVKNIFTGFNEDGVSNESYPYHMGMPISSYQSEVGILNGEYYFIAMDNELCPDEGVCSNWEVFKTDGTEEGTAMVKAIRTGDSGSNSPGIITAPYNGELYFRGSDGTHGDELWKTDGTEEGTVMVKNIANTSDTYNSNPYEFQHFNGYLYFTADSGNSCNEGGKGNELWRTDGTEEGTVIVLDINDECQNNNAGDANPNLLKVVGD